MSGIFKITFSKTGAAVPVKCAKSNDNYMFNYLRGKNLSPLVSDTISFCGKNNNKDDIWQNAGKLFKSTRDSKTLSTNERAISESLSKIMHHEAQFDLSKLKTTLKNSLGSLVGEYGFPCNEKHPIYEMEFRVKTPESLREKASQKSLITKSAVQSGIGDIIGARIILGDNSRKSCEAVINKLSETVKDGQLKIIEVENHAPYDSRHQYFKRSILSKLAKASADRFGIFVKEKNIINESGYTALHLSVAFADGYNGEIQIIGKDVATLKELEDIPYKILQGKQVKPQYYKIKEILSPMCFVDIEGPENAAKIKLRREFMAYTDAAYRYEREKPPASKRKDNIFPRFLSVSEFAQTQKGRCHLTPSMDFNNLYRLKLLADKKISEAKK